MEFPKTASQNADHVPLSDPSLLICSPYLGPSLRFPFIDMAIQGPVIERLCPKWTTDLSDRVVCEHIVVMNQLDPIKELYDMYLEEEDTPRIVEIEDDGLDFVSDVEEPADPYMDL